MDARQIISRWPSKRLLAEDTRRNHITVHSWWQRNSIPSSVDVDMVEAAQRRGIDLSYEELARSRASHETSP